MIFRSSDTHVIDSNLSIISELNINEYLNNAYFKNTIRRYKHRKK